MTTREATTLIPKWSAGENIGNFCKKIEAAWDYCKSENFEEEKFCKILKLQLHTDAAEVMDNMSEGDKKDVSKITKELRSRLDKQKSEYLREFSEVTKRPNEGYNEFALRIKRLYKQGTDSATVPTAGEERMMVETFLNGLPENEGSALRLVSTEEEQDCIDKMAKRAGRVTTRNNKLRDEINSIRKDLTWVQNQFEGDTDQ